MDITRDREAFALIANRADISRSNWYEINAKADDRAEIFVYSAIGYVGATAEEFTSELNKVTAPKIDVRINSAGGSVFDGIAIYQALQEHPAYITTRVDSLAASIASVIAQAGDHRVMLAASEMMIHEATGIFVDATASNMRELADVADNQSEKIAGIYATANGDGRTKSHFLSLMRAGTANLGTWLSPQEAVDEGLADEVRTPKAKEAPADEPAEPVAASTPVDFSSIFDIDPDEFEVFPPTQKEPAHG